TESRVRMYHRLASRYSHLSSSGRDVSNTFSLSSTMLPIVAPWASSSAAVGISGSTTNSGSGSGACAAAGRHIASDRRQHSVVIFICVVSDDAAGTQFFDLFCREPGAGQDGFGMVTGAGRRTGD